MRRFVLPVLAFAAFAAAAPAATYPITNDTYVDNFYISQGGVVIDNAHTNYGHNAAVKGTSNNGSGSDYPGVTSLTHGLFTLPAAFWSAVGAGPVVSTAVTYYARNPSLATSNAAANPNSVNGYRQLELHPLLQPFVAGTGGVGGDTRAGVLNTATAKAGSDWYTVDGTVPWTVAGGTLDPAFAASSLIGTATKQYSPITFDLTALLNNATTRAEIQANGLLLRTTDETSYTGNEFASLISYDSALNGGTYAGYGPSVTVTPEPAALALGGVAAVVTLRRRRAA